MNSQFSTDLGALFTCGIFPYPAQHLLMPPLPFKARASQSNRRHLDISTRWSVGGHHCPMHLPRSIRLSLEDSHELSDVVDVFAIGGRACTTPLRSPLER